LLHFVNFFSGPSQSPIQTNYFPALNEFQFVKLGAGLEIFDLPKLVSQFNTTVIGTKIDINVLSVLQIITAQPQSSACHILNMR
jgi:hypothetical protein